MTLKGVKTDPKYPSKVPLGKTRFLSINEYETESPFHVNEQFFSEGMRHLLQGMGSISHFNPGDNLNVKKIWQMVLKEPMGVFQAERNRRQTEAEDQVYLMCPRHTMTFAF